MKESFDLFLIDQDVALKEAMRRMGQNGGKVLFVIDGQRRLVGSLSDGDVRRWILNGKRLTAKVSKVCNPETVIYPVDYDIQQVKQKMLDMRIEAVPLLDPRGQIRDILIWDEIFREPLPVHKEKLDIPIIIMAGGRGTRLDPFTRILPKPLIPIGDKPVIEVIMDRFSAFGVKEFYLSINHKSKMIKAFFEESKDPYSIKYIEEKIPLGTTGSLKLLKNKIEGSFLVTNCDILVETDYAEFLKFHRDHGFDLTMAVSCKRYVIPYGVCEIIDGGILKSIKEKPEYDLLVNTGMYIMEPSLLDLIPDNKSFHLDELIAAAKKKKFKIGVFPISEKSWVDIGQWEEYQKVTKQLSELL